MIIHYSILYLLYWIILVLLLLLVIVLRSIIATVVAMHDADHFRKTSNPGKLTLLLSCISPVGLANRGNLLFQT